MSADARPVSRAAKALAIALSLVPPARMAWIVFTYGENNLSNDYGMRVPLVLSMLDGTCSFARYFREAWVAGSHSTIAVTPVYYLNARFFAWSVWVELGLGLALAAATVALLAGALPRAARWPLLPLLSLLFFSTSRVTVFTFGEPALQYGISQFGVGIAAFALRRWEKEPVPLAVALTLGGVVTSWSWGGGIMVWPVLVAALALQHARRAATWAILAAGATAGLGQYAWLLPRQLEATTAGNVPWATKARILLDVLGRPFVSGIAHADLNAWSQAVGAAALLGLAVLLALLHKRYRELLVPLFLIAWSLLVAAQIALVRAAVAPWYASPMALFWAGLLMLCAASSAPLQTAGILVIAVSSLIVQATWEDKSFYLPSRSPASAACLRDWRAAPAACAERLFQWGGGGAPPGWLGEPLERHRLSVFGPRRTYLLQGDVAVGRVILEPASAPSFFSRDGKTPGNIEDFHRLDLVLSPGASVSWRVDLPPGTRTARFRTVVRTDREESFDARGAAVSASAGPDGPTIASRVFLPRGEKRALVLDVSRFAGRTVKLSLGAEETQTPGAPLVWEAPRVELALERAK